MSLTIATFIISLANFILTLRNLYNKDIKESKYK
jgi:hypothetical protein